MAFYSNNTLATMKFKSQPGRKQKVMNDLFKTASFEKGFMKAAQDEGLSYYEAKQLYKQANPGMTPPPSMEDNGLLGGAMGAGLGALGGGAVGYMGGRNKENPENDTRYRDALLGALLGGAGGGLVGGAAGVSSHMNQPPPPPPGLLEKLMGGR